MSYCNLIDYGWLIYKESLPLPEEKGGMGGGRDVWGQGMLWWGAWRTRGKRNMIGLDKLINKLKKKILSILMSLVVNCWATKTVSNYWGYDEMKEKRDNERRKLETCKDTFYITSLAFL